MSVSTCLEHLLEGSGCIYRLMMEFIDINDTFDQLFVTYLKYIVCLKCLVTGTTSNVFMSVLISV